MWRTLCVCGCVLGVCWVYCVGRCLFTWISEKWKYETQMIRETSLKQYLLHRHWNHINMRMRTMCTEIAELAQRYNNIE